jgi:hypothetical protein
MKTFAFVLCSILSIKSCGVGVNISSNNIKGNGRIVSKEIAVNNYSEIKLQIPGDVFYEQKQSAAPYFRIEIDENLADTLDIRVENNALIIETENRRDNIHPTKCHIYTNSTQLSAIYIAGSGSVQTKDNLHSDRFAVKVSGSGNAVINQLTCNKLNADIAGSGNISADRLDCEDLSVNIAGSGDVELQGKAGNATIAIAGSGDVKAYHLLVQEMKCSIAGSGDIEANVVEKMNVSVAGSGDVKYKGNPVVKKSVAGSGSVERQK